MITSFVNMEATQVPPQQPNPNIQATLSTILRFLKTCFTKEKIVEVNQSVSKCLRNDHRLSTDDLFIAKKNPDFILLYMHIVLNDKNLFRSKKDHAYKNVKSIIWEIDIEIWEISLNLFLLSQKKEPDSKVWTVEEEKVWRHVLFFISEQLGAIHGSTHCFMLRNQERRAELSPLLRQLGLKDIV